LNPSGVWKERISPRAATRLEVTDCIISSNGSASTGGGIRIRPTGTGTVSGAASQVKLLNNAGIGLSMDGSAGTGAQMVFALRDSAVSGNVVMGVSANAGAGTTPARIVIDRTAVLGSTTGVSSTGSGADITIGYSVVSGNTTGVSFTAPATLRTYTSNQLRGNTFNNGTFSGSIPLE
jgi:hypothetical protein